MKKFLLCLILLILMSGKVSADDAWTPAKIKDGINADIFSDSITFHSTVSYVTGVWLSFVALQNHGLIKNYLCDTSGMTIEDMKFAIDSTKASDYPNTNDGGIQFIFYALFDEYSCTE